jgi:MoaA/NifB/PqqE/SkfB family radical SAM enzyme
MSIHDLTAEEKIERRNQYMRPDFPYAYGISLGEWQCNHSFRMCPMYNRPPQQERYITGEIFSKACLEVGERRDVSIEISAYGETYMHPEADDFMFTVRRLCPNATVVVATNGSLLDRERCEK